MKSQNNHQPAPTRRALAAKKRKVMEATISLYEPLHDHLKTKTKRGKTKSFVYVVECGPFVKIFPSESSAERYLVRNGFVLSDDCSHYTHKFKSEDQSKLENLYKKR